LRSQENPDGAASDGVCLVGLPLPGTVLSTLHVDSYLVTTITQEGGNCNYLCFPNEEMEVREAIFLKITQLKFEPVLLTYKPMIFADLVPRK
jgi:hypothetical protein